MNKRWYLLLVLLLIGALGLVACGTTTQEPAAPSGGETGAQTTDEGAGSETTDDSSMSEMGGRVLIWHALKEGELEALNKVIDLYKQSHPNVQVDLLFTPFDDLRGKFETAAATGEGPTLLIGAADWGPALYDAELIADVSSMADNELLSEINEAALGAVQYKGALIGLPHVIKGVVMYRNASIMLEAASSFDDLVAKASAATEGDILGADLERGFFFSAAHLNAQGGELMDADGYPAFNTEAGVAWLNLLNRFSEAGPAEYYTDNDVDLFKLGQVGVVIDGTWNLSALKDAIGADSLMIDPWPAGMSGYVQTDNIYLSANATGDDKEASWMFMHTLLSAEAQAFLANAGNIPSNVNVEVSDPHLAMAVEAFGGGAAFPVVPEMGAYWGPMDTALKSVFDEGADPATVLTQAEATIRAAVDEIKGQ